MKVLAVAAVWTAATIGPIPSARASVIFPPTTADKGVELFTIKHRGRDCASRVVWRVGRFTSDSERRALRIIGRYAQDPEAVPFDDFPDERVDEKTLDSVMRSAVLRDWLDNRIVSDVIDLRRKRRKLIKSGTITLDSKAGRAYRAAQQKLWNDMMGNFSITKEPVGKDCA